MIDGKVLPIASIGVAPSARIAGVETTAPPTPNIPESTPVKNPAIRTRMVWRGSDKNTDTTQGPPDTLSSMASDLQLRGVYIPLVTPFAADGSVALDAVTLLCHEYLDAGASGIVALGTTGESTALSSEEKRAVIDACAMVCSERSAQLIVGAGTNSTASTVSAVQALAGTPSLVATLIVVPYYVRPSEAGIVAHYRAVADASPVPLVLYNIGMRTGRHLSAAGVLEVAEHPNVAGIKQAATGLDLDTLELLAGASPDFAVLGGEDPFLFPLVLMGGAGAICASAHVCTERFVAMIECGLAGKVDDGRAHAEALLPVVKSLFVEPNPAVFKGVLHAQGRIPTPDVRLPLLNASDASVAACLAAVQAAS
jgi:4-hydroxy-tetrahydrodipicolinate synthase